MAAYRSGKKKALNSLIGELKKLTKNQFDMGNAVVTLKRMIKWPMKKKKNQLEQCIKNISFYCICMAILLDQCHAREKKVMNWRRKLQATFTITPGLMSLYRTNYLHSPISKQNTNRLLLLFDKKWFHFKVFTTLQQKISTLFKFEIDKLSFFNSQ